MLAQAEVSSIPESASDDLATGDLGWAASRGVLALLAQTGVTKVLGLAGSIILARLLFPADFGVFAIVSLSFGLFSILGDLGLGGSLIQQALEPNPRELRVVFTVQQLLTIAASGLIVLAAPIAVNIYHLHQDVVWLIRLMVLYLVASSFRTMPAILLTRSVRFKQLAIIDVISAFTYQVVTVVGALAGLRVWALGTGLVASAVSAAIVINLWCPWPIGWSWDWPLAKSHLRFGLPFQGAMSLAGLEMASAAVIVGLLSGPTALGYAAFALTLVNFGLVLPNLIWRVCFPAMSRLQSEAERAARLFEVALRATLYLVSIVYLPLLVYGNEIVKVVYSTRWLPVLPVLRLFVLSWILRSMGAVIFTAFNSMGRSKLSFWSHVMITVASWLLAIMLVPAFGLAGLGTAWLVVVLPIPALLLLLKRRLPFRLKDSLVPPLMPFVSVLVLNGLANLLPVQHAWEFTTVTAGLSASLYFGMLAVIERQHVEALGRLIRSKASGYAMSLSRVVAFK